MRKNDAQLEAIRKEIEDDSEGCVGEDFVELLLDLIELRAAIRKHRECMMGGHQERVGIDEPIENEIDAELYAHIDDDPPARRKGG